MILKFHAKSVVTEEPDRICLLVGFGDEYVDAKDYLLLQRSIEHSEQDIALGQNTYHVELRSQAYSGYGVLSQFSLHRNYLELSISSGMLAQFDNISGAHITFELSDQEFFVLQDRLVSIFSGSNCFRVAT